jgi:hypothetical protein
VAIAAHHYPLRRITARPRSTLDVVPTFTHPQRYMTMQCTEARVTIEGLSIYGQSHQHAEPKLKGELPDAYDLRTWPSKMNTETKGDKTSVVIPAFGFHLALMSAAKYSKKKIEGQGNATWTKKIEAGIMTVGDGWLGVDPATVRCLAVSVNSDGVRGSGKRVIKRFPQIDPPWSATFHLMILDPIITQEIFAEIAGIAGLFVGVGQYRPEKGGSNGRFAVKKLAWDDQRQFEPSKLVKMMSEMKQAA